MSPGPLGKNRNVPTVGISIVLLVGSCLVGQVDAQELTFSAVVDKTAVKAGEAVTLTLTLSGDVGGVEVPPFEFPEGFSVTARSQGSSFTLHGGTMERSMTLTYVLVPQRDGTFQLGPFQIEHEGTTIPTEPITITVEKQALPPSLSPQGGRITL